MKLWIEHENAPSFQTLMEKDFNVIFGLICLVSNIRKEVSIVLDFIFSLLRKYEKKNPIICYSWCWIQGFEQRVTIIEEYDARSLYPMFLKCYHHLTSSG